MKQSKCAEFGWKMEGGGLIPTSIQRAPVLATERNFLGVLESRITKIEKKCVFGQVEGKKFSGLLLCRRDSRNTILLPHNLQSPLEYTGWKHAVEGWVEKMTQES